MASIDLTATYTLRSIVSAQSKALASYGSDQVTINSPSSGLNQQWFFTTALIAGRYHLHTVQNGDSKSLDVNNDQGTSSTGLYFADTGSFTGQWWKLEQWNDGTFKLSNNFTGINVYLGINSTTQSPYLSSGEDDSKHWAVERFGSQSSATSTMSTTQMATSTPTRTNNPVDTNVTATATPGSTDLSAGAIAGFSIGIVCVVGLIIGAIFFFLKRRRQSAAAANQSLSPHHYHHNPTSSLPPSSHGGTFPYEILSGTPVLPPDQLIMASKQNPAHAFGSAQSQQHYSSSSSTENKGKPSTFTAVELPVESFPFELPDQKY